METTVGQLLVDEALPSDLRGQGRSLDKKSLKQLLTQLAERDPETYREVSHRLADVGREVAQSTGGFSFGLQHMAKSPKARERHQRLQQEVDRILNDENLDEETREQRVAEAVVQHMDPQQQEVFEEAKAEGNPLAGQVISGSRGSPMNLASLRGADLLYADHRDRPVPVPITHSYSEGLTPAEYWAGSYGARKGVIDTKLATQQAGYFGKVLNQVAHRLAVTGDDSDQPHQRLRGMPVRTDDPDNEGALLAQQTGPYDRNTVLTPKILHDLKQRGHDEIAVRSPLAADTPPGGGVYARDVGVREKGRLPSRGEIVGLAAAQALAEPLSQGMLCLAAGTPVRMADGSTKAIETIKPGDWVVGVDKHGRAMPVRVRRRFDNGDRDCVRTRFRFCRSHDPQIELVSTEDHKVWSVRMRRGSAGERWNHVPALYPVGTSAKEGSFAAVLSEGGEFGDTSDSRALLLGLLLGDGAYTESVGTTNFSCADPSLVSDLESYLNQRNLKLTKLEGHENYYSVSMIEDRLRRDDRGRVKPGSRNPARQLLEEKGCWGKYAHEKVIPDDVYRWTNKSVAQLIAGLWITDGTVYLSDRSGNKPYLAFGSTSKGLVEQVRDLLAWRFGVYSSKIDANNRNDRKRTLYSIAISSHRCVQKFLHHIPLKGDKAERVRQWKDNFSPSCEVGYAKCGRYDQTPYGRVNTHDIEVDHPDHMFMLANGLVVSNSSKHSGGVAGEAKSVGGFEALEQLVQAPRQLKGGAAHAERDGTIDRVEEAPAGGRYVYVDGQPHYVGDGFELKVQPGDRVEAGDVISDGIPHPGTITKHKGLGEGRRYFTDAFRQTMEDADLNSNRRNVELLGRGLINHVRLTDEYGDYVPDDVVPYTEIEQSWQPREGTKQLKPDEAAHKYLERPVLHHTIGTQLKPSMARELKRFGIDQVDVHDDPPPFQPEMVKGMYNLQHDPDWLTRMYGSGLKKSLLSGAHRGAGSKETGTSFVPGLARGTDFGRQGLLQPEKQSTSIVDIAGG